MITNNEKCELISILALNKMIIFNFINNKTTTVGNITKDLW